MNQKTKYKLIKIICSVVIFVGLATIVACGVLYFSNGNEPRHMVTILPTNGQYVASTATVTNVDSRQYVSNDIIYTAYTIKYTEDKYGYKSKYEYKIEGFDETPYRIGDKLPVILIPINFIPDKDTHI